MRSQNLSFITWIRVISAIFIFACHCCNECEIPLVAMLAQIFNIGVHLFFILSGFLVGYKGISGSYGKWFCRRLKRIFVPYWLFLGVLAAVYLVLDLDFTEEWIQLMFGLQGSVVGIVGAGHTWFISALLICYAAAPAIDCLNRRISSLGNRYVNGAFLLLIGILPVAYALFEDAWVYTLLTPVSIFTLAYLYGTQYKDPLRVRLKRKDLKWAIMIALLSLGTRFAARVLIDGTIWYDRVIVPYTHTITAFAIVAIAELLVGNSDAPRIIRLLGGVSFEIYLYHYMFTDGPLSLFGCTPIWLINCILIFMLVMPIACAGNWLYKLLGTSKNSPFAI